MLYEGSCHCGDVAFDVEADFTYAISCNCSICRRKGTLLAFVPRSALNLKTPEDNMTSYRFNSEVIDHKFCSRCGCTAFADGKGPDGSEVAAVNLRCVPAVDLEAISITPYDGASK